MTLGIHVPFWGPAFTVTHRLDIGALPFRTICIAGITGEGLANVAEGYVTGSWTLFLLVGHDKLLVSIAESGTTLGSRVKSVEGRALVRVVH
ncbi:MAG: hypothetical protein L0154_08050 [Chloroflexi bacterium]|nr:hypothetical protein [Chloroflexota bacterium]